MFWRIRRGYWDSVFSYGKTGILICSGEYLRGTGVLVSPGAIRGHFYIYRYKMIFIPQTGLPSTRGFITDDSGVSASKSLVHVTPILPTTSLPPPGPSRGNPTDLPRPTLPHNSHHLFDVAVLERLPLKSHVPYPSNTYISSLRLLPEDPAFSVNHFSLATHTAQPCLATHTEQPCLDTHSTTMSGHSHRTTMFGHTQHNHV